MAPSPVIRLHDNDAVLIARTTLLPGIEVMTGVVTSERIPAGHKVAIRPIATGEEIRRYGQIIGFAARAIHAGEHVHIHNVELRAFERHGETGVDATPLDRIEPAATFQGIVRPDGRVATRNYLGVVSTVNCSATVSRAIADRMGRELEGHPSIDGVVVFPAIAVWS